MDDPCGRGRGRAHSEWIGVATNGSHTRGRCDGAYDQERILYYDDDWRLVEERIDDGADEVPGDGVDRHAQMVWGQRRTDEAVMRRENSDLGDDDPDVTYDHEWCYLTDALYSVVAVVDGATGDLVERVRHTPYGEGRHSWFDDVDGDGDADSADLSVISAAQNKEIGQSGYVVDADINRSGKITLADSALYAAKSALAAGFVSEGGAGAPDSPVGWCGYLYSFEAEAYLSRARWQSPRLGRWLERDPLGFVDGSGLYQYARSNPTNFTDPSGLAIRGVPERILFEERFRSASECGEFRVNWVFMLDGPATSSGWIVQHVLISPNYRNCAGEPQRYHEVQEFYETANEGMPGVDANWGIAAGEKYTSTGMGLPGTFQYDDRFGADPLYFTEGRLNADGTARFFAETYLTSTPLFADDWNRFQPNFEYALPPWTTNSVFLPGDHGGRAPHFWDAQAPFIRVEGAHGIEAHWDCVNSLTQTDLSVYP